MSQPDQAGPSEPELEQEFRAYAEEMPAPTPQAALYFLRPGDRVLVALNSQPDEAESREWVEDLERLFPGVRFVMVGDVASVLVQPGAAT